MKNLIWKVRFKPSFTLAEVLITLGIIGIVAAMILSPLVQNIRKKETESRLKKFISVINQTLTFAENDYGLREDWNIASEMNTFEGAENFLTTYIKPYVKNLGIEKRLFFGLNMATIRFLDGSQMSIKIGTCYDIYFDVNGDKKPNEKGKDIFVFILCRKKGHCNHSSNQVRPFYCETNGTEYPTREEIIANCKTSGTYCTMLLEQNNWEFPKDYPIVYK